MVRLFFWLGREIGGAKKEQMSLLLPLVQMKMNLKECRLVNLETQRQILLN